MTCSSGLQDDDDVSFFFIFSCKFYSTHINKPTFSNQGVSRESHFHLPWFNLDTFDLEQHSVSTITFGQDAAVLVCRAQGVSAGPGNYFLKRNLSTKF